MPDDRGRPPDVTDAEVRDALADALAASHMSAVFTGDVAGRLPIGQRAVNERLKQLVGDGVRRNATGNCTIWELERDDE